MNDVSYDPEVKFVRLKNGDDVIAEVVEFSENEEAVVFALINPLKIVYIPSSKGVAYLQVAFMPWVFSRICDNQEFMVHAEDVLTMNNASEKMTDYYWSNLSQMTGKSESVEEDYEEPEEETMEEVETILEAIKSGRTYH